MCDNAYSSQNTFEGSINDTFDQIFDQYFDQTFENFFIHYGDQEKKIWWSRKRKEKKKKMKFILLIFVFMFFLKKIMFKMLSSFTMFCLK